MISQRDYWQVQIKGKNVVPNHRPLLNMLLETLMALVDGTITHHQVYPVLMKGHWYAYTKAYISRHP